MLILKSSNDPGNYLSILEQMLDEQRVIVHENRIEQLLDFAVQYIIPLENLQQFLYKIH